MKILKIGLLSVMLLLAFSLGGCGKKSVVQPNLQRDNYNTGGNLTFDYDEISHVATFGGEGQVVQYYESDIAKGWYEAGNRIGFILAVPIGIKDYKSGKATFDGKKMTPDDYVSLQEEQTLIATFQPIVEKEKKNYTLKITWEEGTKEQVYQIVIADGTIFMEIEQ